MAAPAIERLFDSTVRIWRATPERSALGVEERTYFVVIVSAGAKVNRSTAPEADGGPGLQPTGGRRIYMKPDVDVQSRDLVELVTGADAPQFWEVNEPPTRPQDHHTQLDCIAWNGETPTEES